jgi:hypothetical protein
LTIHCEVAPALEGAIAPSEGKLQFPGSRKPTVAAPVPIKHAEFSFRERQIVAPIR